MKKSLKRTTSMAWSHHGWAATPFLRQRRHLRRRHDVRPLGVVAAVGDGAVETDRPADEFLKREAGHGRHVEQRLFLFVDENVDRLAIFLHRGFAQDAPTAPLWGIA